MPYPFFYVGERMFLTELQLQYLVDQVAVATGEKGKYYVKFVPRKRYGAVAYVWDWLRWRTNRRVMGFSRNETYGWFETESDENQPPEQVRAYHESRRKNLIRDIVHEIAHFKQYARWRTKAKTTYGHYLPPEVMRKRRHPKRFKTIVDKLWKNVEPHLDELMKLDLTKITPPSPKPKPTKQQTLEAKLAKVEKHIKLLETRIKRTTTILKKWKKKRKYYQKQLSLFLNG